MITELNSFFTNYTLFLLCALLAGGLFFLMAGLRDLKNNPSMGSLCLALAAFFIAGHLLVMANVAEDIKVMFGFWDWLVSMLAPALIALFLILGAFSLAKLNFHDGLLKTFFGLTLLCYLFMVGQSWPLDVRGIIAGLYGSFWFDTELRSA